MDFLVAILMIGLLQQQVGAIRVEEPDENNKEYRINSGSGSSFELQCTFKFENDETIFNSPTSWSKCQDTEYCHSNNAAEYSSHSVQFATLAVIDVDLFYDNGRITSELVQSNNNERVTLKVKFREVQKRDSGYYRCQAARQGEDPVYRSFSVFVLDEIDEVTMYAATELHRLTNPGGINNNNTNNVVFVDKQDSYFQCQSVGGYPLPTVKLFIGGKQRTEYLKDKKEEIMFSGETEEVMGVLSAHHRLSTDKFRLTKEDNDKMIRCEAEIAKGEIQFSRKERTKTVSVYFQPEFSSGCLGKFPMPKDSEQVKMTCVITARPAPTSIVWHAKKNGVNVTSNSNERQPDLNIEASHTVAANDSTVATLTFFNVDYKHFQYYMLIVQNDVGMSQLEIEVKEGELIGEQIGGSTQLSPTSVFLVSLFSVIALYL